jgi:sensor histidine kinase YesM
MKLLKQILILDLAVGAVACLLLVTLHPSDRTHILTQLASSLTIGFLIITPIVLVFRRFGASIYSRRAPMNWILVVTGILACSFVGTLLYNAGSLALGLLAPHVFWASLWTRMQFSAILALIFGISGFAYQALRDDLEAATLELRSRQLESERASKLTAEAQLASLESHVRPHFLFNTLNTISSLIPENPILAEALVGKLAALLRLSLDSNQARVASLERELKIVNDYLEIERARFGDRLRVRIQVPDELLRAEVPALSVQTLIENSVRHAVAARLEGAEIRLAAFAQGERICVEVSDDGPGFAVAAIRPGHGLDNLQRRLAALFGPVGKLEISQSGEFTVVSLCLPLHVRQSA